MRLATFSLLALWCGAALAQPAGGVPAPTRPPLLQDQPDTRLSQRIERIQFEDAGSRVDELRYGGETQSITVQPKADVPAYQVQPGGTRVWNLLRF